MALRKVTIHSTENIPFTAATMAVEEAMDWDFFRAHKFCKEADEEGSSVLCIASEDKAQDYAQKLADRSIIVSCPLA